MNAAIIGATGYGGAELLRLLKNHPVIKVHSVHSSSQQGKELSESYPHLQQHPYTLEDINPDRLAEEVDLVFTATPSGVSSKVVPQLLEAGCKVVDLSGDFRLLNTGDYEKWYKKEAAPLQWLENAVYGLTEWVNREKLQNTQLVANPGCYPTATLLGLAPLVKNSLVDPKSIIVDAKSAVSGAGRTPNLVTHFAEMNDNFKIYKVNQHQHIPEIEQVLKEWNEAVETITFSTHLVPMTRGIMATIYANVKEGILASEIRKAFEKSYKDSYFVRLRKEGEYPSTKEVYGSNYCDLSFSFDERTGRLTVVSVIDNLVKGAAGQAIQNVNVMLGLDEKTGLEFIPVYP
ncbi:N-acetyl-gamma-glutamyl-phosphate reductase [Bacillus taeanensis]|uniref:N-acetyl-gamma-glutamyl-phosphate reductase n=1 Tax=Bacillus taeanensis TaxID=273032 RepID=A0A366XXD1_9BACI|nr:N-acetyl-gamma-glutamyl-phosphate reductase [Bacillus taeanensis]RBW71050.1 N-acetyl-gamma-glutamyl-phosphate reductase [Bacillus taeanensis]